jgi:hypothetical protein
MKKVSCQTENCISTQSSCVIWNGGDVEFLGICNGESINLLLWEMLEKLKAITGDDLSSFDIDALTSICQAKAPHEITVLSILEMVKSNQLCLKDYIDAVDAKINELFKDEQIDVNLKCLADFDNLGNALVPNRKTLDQLVVDELCRQKDRLTVLEAEVLLLKTQAPTQVEAGEKSIATCVDAAVKPTSAQVQEIATVVCEQRTATGTPADIATALSKAGSDWQTKYGNLPGWTASPQNAAQFEGNLAVIATYFEQRLSRIETGCCAPSCDDIKVGFSAMFNEDLTSVILKFSAGAGTNIPAGFIDKGSVVSIKDADGNVETSALGIHNNLEEEVFIYGLNVKGTLDITLNYKIGNDSLVCEKTLTKQVKSAACAYCELTATGDAGSSVVIIYQDPNANNTVDHVAVYQSTTTTTTIPV